MVAASATGGQHDHQPAGDRDAHAPWPATRGGRRAATRSSPARTGRCRSRWRAARRPAWRRPRGRDPRPGRRCADRPPAMMQADDADHQVAHERMHRADSSRARDASPRHRFLTRRGSSCRPCHGGLHRRDSRSRHGRREPSRKQAEPMSVRDAGRKGGVHRARYGRSSSPRSGRREARRSASAIRRSTSGRSAEGRPARRGAGRACQAGGARGAQKSE